MLSTTRLSDNLTQLDLVPLGLEGFEHFISSYVFKDDATTFLIDIGPASTAPDLLYALQTLNVPWVDYILLTHIHLDHAGAAGHLAQAFPQAKIVCHPMGLKHLHAPQKLWQSSLSVLKDFAVAYHEPQGVPLEQLVSVDDFDHSAISSIKTPGHAPHHVSYVHEECLFIGEAAGVFFNLADGYLRPATAKRVLLDEGRDMRVCIDELLSIDPLLRYFSLFNAAEQKRERGFYENALLGIVGWLQEGSAPLDPGGCLRHPWRR